MKLTCPACGAVASAEAWENDMVIREAFLVITSLPHPIPRVLLSYLSLFRPGQRALGWKKALRLTREISSLVAAGHVQVKGKVARPCPPHLWAQAMEQMAERRVSLSLPLKNHNYLRQVAYHIADREDAARETMVRTSELSGSRAAEVRGTRAVDLIDAPVPPFVQDFLDKMKKRATLSKKTDEADEL